MFFCGDVFFRILSFVAFKAVAFFELKGSALAACGRARQTRPGFLPLSFWSASAREDVFMANNSGQASATPPLRTLEPEADREKNERSDEVSSNVYSHTGTVDRRWPLLQLFKQNRGVKGLLRLTGSMFPTLESNDDDC